MTKQICTITQNTNYVTKLLLSLCTGHFTREQSYLILSSVKVVLDEATVSWGIKVERVEMYDE